MSSAAPDWDTAVTRPAGSCAGCGRAFEPGATAVALLDLGAEGFARRDLCEACFAGGAGSPFSFWRRRVEEGEARRRPVLDLGYLIEFFHRLRTHGSAPETAATLFIVAILLVRKRAFELLGTASEGGVSGLRVRQRKGTEVWFVPDPGLTEETLTSVRENVARIFDLGESGERAGE